MILSYNKLKEMGINLPLKELENNMFQLGHEVEEVEETNIDKLVIGHVIEVVKHSESDKLSIVQVDIKSEILQIVCGAKNISKGQNVIVATEGAQIGDLIIKPVELRGVKSNGMICSLEELGYKKDVLDKEDYEGIHEINEDVEIGTNPMDSLNLGDKLLDIFLTSNRGDCQNYKGIYNELASLLNYKNELKIPKYEIEKKINTVDITNPFNLTVDSIHSEYFSHYYIEGVSIEKSNWDTKLFLMKQGIKSQNSLVDLSNKYLLETGIPSHMYDADKIVGGLNLITLDKDEVFVGLDENEYSLTSGTLVIKDDEKIVSVAGVMGSFDTKVTDETKNILLEVASFKGSSVFNSSKVLKKKTEAALRYEKEIDKNILENVATNIISDIVLMNDSAKVSNVVLKEEPTIENEKISLNYESACKILGLDISKDEIIRILESLDFELEISDEHLIAKAPSYRKDQYLENDLIEEIIRIYNIDNIEVDSIINNFSPLEKVTDNKYEYLKKIENIMLKQNINQVITYSLVNEKQIKEFNQDINKSVKLMSSLSKEHEYYRQSLIPSLIKIAKDNFSYQEKSIEIFEIAQTYIKESEEIIEDTKLSLLLAGNYQSEYLGAKRKYDFYDVKGKLEKLCEELNVSMEIKECSDEYEQLNPYASSDIYINGIKVGFIGEVIFDYYKKMNEKIYIFEISLNEIEKILKQSPKFKYEKITFLPEITRDLTIEVDKDVTYEKVKHVFSNINYLNDVKLIDIYEGEYIDIKKKKISFRLSFSNDGVTLTNEIVDKEIKKIFQYCDEKKYIIYGK